MASSGKFDFSASSPSRQLYTSGKRGSHTAASMDRSASFRDTMENPILSSLPSMSRSSVNVSQGDVTSFLQCLRFDLKSMAAEYKCNRYGDFKRLANAALCAPDDAPSGLFKGKLTSYSPEDLKRLKVGLRESTIKARERVKTFSDVLSVMNKCFPSIPSRKRSRPDAFSAGVTVGKMGTQSHTLTSAFDVEQQKVEERGKNVIPNKRTRTSLVDQRADVRPNTPARSSGSIDRDREISRLPNSNTLQGVDGMLPMVVDGWEKAKMKKKRTVIKVDWAPSTSSVLSKPTDGSREPKQGMHPRSLADSRSRLNDPHEFRSGAANGSIRSSIPRPEQENISVLHDKRDQTTKLAQERTNVGAFNKANARQDFMSGPPSSTTKPHAVARGPRSGPSAVPKMTNVQSPTISNGSNPGLTSTNRKRGLSTRSSSPPVAQWADRRPQKISRTARRTNLIPVLSTNEEVPPLSNSNISEKGRGFAKRLPTSSPKQFKSKGDSNIQSSTLSESEDSGAAEIRSRDSLKSEEIGDKDGLNVQKMSTLVLPTRRNKFMNEKHHRTGRGFARSVGKLGTEKQHRTGRVGSDKPESKVGRPPTRKLSGRQAYTRQKQSAFTAATDFLDDGHGELVAAANAVMNPVYALPNPFWKQMDPHFGFVSDASLTCLKQEMQLSLPRGNTRSTANFTNSIDDCDMENGTESGCEYSENLTSGTSPRGITLCRRLLAALISEEDDDDDDELNYNVYGSAFEPETDLIGGSFSSSYRIDSTLRSCNEVASSAVATGFDHRCNGLLSNSGKIHTISSSQYQYGDKSMDERLLIEIHSLGLYPEYVPDLVQTGDEDISKDISRLEEKHHQQVLRKKSLLDKLLKSTEETMALQEKEFERLSLEKLTGMAYQKYMSCWNKSTSSKMAKQAALDFVKRTLDRCHEFETTGISCFSESLFKEIFHSGLSHQNHTEDAIDRHQSRKVNGANMEDFSGTQVSPMLNNHDIYPSEPTTGKDDVWSSKSKKRELYLDDVAAGSPCTSSGTPSGVGRVIINSVKGKRSEREPRNGGPKVGRPAKIKAKQKQKTTQLSAPVNGTLGNFSDQQRAKSSFAAPKPAVNEEDESALLEEEEPLDLSHLQLPEMVDFGGQGEDIGSWLNIDDDILQHDDDDFMGLEIPMDDLTDLNMMV